VLLVYRGTGGFPAHENFGLRSQLRRASVSIAAHIAEGAGRGSDADFARLLNMAFGSACEAEYLILLATDLGYLPKDEAAQLNAHLTDAKRMLSGLLGKIRLADS
jgi:four helix bundle protein